MSPDETHPSNAGSVQPATSNALRRLFARLAGSGDPVPLRYLVGHAAVLGMLGGWIEAFYLTVRQLATGQPALWYYPEILWMAPLSAGLVSALLALGLAALCRLLQVRVGLGQATFLFSLPAALAVLTAPGIPLYPAAEVVAGIGIAATLGRLAATRSARLLRAMPRIIAAAALLALLLIATGLWQLPAMRERRALAGLPAPADGTPNVLLIILDTVRATNLSLYGYDRTTSPNLDRWAATGVVFDRAIATAPWTLPSHASMFTGQYNVRLGTGITASLDRRYPTLAGALAGLGYATAGFVGNLGYTTRASGLDRGFARYIDFPVDAGMFMRTAWLPRLVVRPLTAHTGLFHWSVPKRAGQVNDEFEAWLEDRPDRPFFVFLNYYDAHGPYDAPPDYRGRFGPPPIEEVTAGQPHSIAELAPSMNAYDSCIAYLDDQLGRVFDMLAAHGLDDNTLVIVASDHGEMFGENGQVAHTSGLYMPALHVPLVMRLPGVLPRGVRVTAPVTLRDLPRTVLDIIGADETAIAGESLARHWRPVDPGQEARALLSEIDYYDWAPAWTPVHRGDMKSLVLGRLHYIRNGDGTEELYDAVSDPAETDDLAERPDMQPGLARLRAALRPLLGAPAPVN